MAINWPRSGRPHLVARIGTRDTGRRIAAEGETFVIIDVHGHYTTAPKSLETWRNRQIAGIGDKSAMPKVSELKISDDELRESIATESETMIRTNSPSLRDAIRTSPVPLGAIASTALRIKLISSCGVCGFCPHLG